MSVTHSVSSIIETVYLPCALHPSFRSKWRCVKIQGSPWSFWRSLPEYGIWGCWWAVAVTLWGQTPVFSRGTITPTISTLVSSFVASHVSLGWNVKSLLHLLFLLSKLNFHIPQRRYVWKIYDLYYSKLRIDKVWTITEGDPLAISGDCGWVRREDTWQPWSDSVLMLSAQWWLFATWLIH